MSIDTIRDPMVEFVVKVIAHKSYQSSRSNSVTYVAIDLSYKFMKKDHNYDLAKLQLQKLTKNVS